MPERPAPDRAWYRITERGIEVSVRLTPKSARDGIDGLTALDDGSLHLKVRVRAVPEKGKANKALTALMAKATGLPKSRISLISGDTSRLKTLLVDCDAEAWRVSVAKLGL